MEILKLPSTPPPSNTAIAPVPRRLIVSFGLLFLLLLIYLFTVAISLRIDYFDSYSILVNARLIGTGKEGEYFWKRPPVLPLLLSPLFAFEQASGLPLFGYISSHIFAVCIYAALILMVFKLTHTFSDHRMGLWTAFLLGINPLLIHMAPMAKEDILGALLTTAIMALYHRAGSRAHIHYSLPTGIFIGLAMLTRYHFIPLFFVFILLYELLSGRTSLRLRPGETALASPIAFKKYACYLLLPLGCFLLIPSTLYVFLDLATPSNVLQQFLNNLWRHFTLVSQTPEPSWQNYAFLYECLTPSLVLCAVIGIVRAWIRGMQGRLFFSLWLVLFFLYQTYLISPKEARYLFPLFPPLYYFVAAGLTLLFDWIQHLFGNASLRRGASAVVTIVLLLSPAQKVFEECVRLQDPVYRKDFERRVSLYADSLAGPGQDLFWVGPFYALHPRKYMFHPEDEFTSVYHFYNQVVQFFTGRKKVYVLSDARLLPTRPGSMVFVGPNILWFARPGDVLIINREETAYSSRSLDRRRKPLLVERVRTLEFITSGKTADGRSLLTNRDHPDSYLLATPTPKGILFKGSNLPDGRYEMYLQVKGMARGGALTMIDVRGGEFTLLEERLKPGLEVMVIVLLYYDGVKYFTPPSLNMAEDLGA